VDRHISSASVNDHKANICPFSITIVAAALTASAGTVPITVVPENALVTATPRPCAVSTAKRSREMRHEHLLRRRRVVWCKFGSTVELPDPSLHSQLQTGYNHCVGPKDWPAKRAFGNCKIVPPPSCGTGSGSTLRRRIGYYQSYNVRDRSA